MIPPMLESPNSSKVGNKVRVFLVDDQSLLRAAFKSLLATHECISVVGDCGDARSAIDRIALLLPDVVLLDISMPGLSGLDSIRQIREAHSRVRILMLTHHEGENFVDQAMRAGADGYLSKDSDPGELILGIETVSEGRPYLSPKVAGGLVARMRRSEPLEPLGVSRLSTLTGREREVFQLLALGKSNKDVARQLDISLGTAKKHRENLQRKLDCHSTAELARLAIREGLMQN
ncbi:MAG: response regulator transcription factor [Planctomycetes bacterium]|nr:response regulator transcription factor [Planctomycetota bacterium]